MREPKYNIGEIVRYSPSDNIEREYIIDRIKRIRMYRLNIIGSDKLGMQKIVYEFEKDSCTEEQIKN